MYTVQDDIKNNSIKPAYLLFGDEQYLVLFYRNSLVEAIFHKKPEELSGDMNFARFAGSGINLKEVAESARTLPFFAERRVILIDNSGWFEKSSEEVAQFIREIPESTCVIFSERSVDKRTSTYKAISKAGRIDEFPEQKVEDLQQWVSAKLNASHQKITKGAVDTLIRSTGPDMVALSTELEKLCAYCMDKEFIAKEDVEALCHVQATDRVFDMIQFMATRKRKEALLLYYDLLELREPPSRILSLMERQFRILIAVKNLRNKGLDKQKIAERIQIQPFVAGKCITQASYFKKEDLVQALKDAAEFDRQSKLGGISDRMAVELFIVKYSEADE